MLLEVAGVRNPNALVNKEIKIMYSLIDALLAKVESVANQPNLIITMVDKLLSKIVLTEDAHACNDVYCQWRDRCRNLSGGWHQNYKRKYCLTNCGYWYDTGQECCTANSPGSC